MSKRIWIDRKVTFSIKWQVLITFERELRLTPANSVLMGRARHNLCKSETCIDSFTSKLKKERNELETS